MPFWAKWAIVLGSIGIGVICKQIAKSESKSAEDELENDDTENDKT